MSHLKQPRAKMHPKARSGLVSSLMEIARFSPPVIFYRSLILVENTFMPSAHGQMEIYRMSSEKWVTSVESTLVFWTESIKAQQQLVIKLAVFYWQFWFPTIRQGGRKRRLPGVSPRILEKSIRPIKREVKNNARRLRTS